MPNAIQASSLTTRLFLEGIEIDLSEDIDINNSYGIATVQNIGSKQSNFSKTITLPGTSNNNALFSYLFNIQSTGANTSQLITTYSSIVTNLISGVTVTNVNLIGSTFAPPINNGFSETSFHSAVNNSDFYIDISGNTSTSGYIVCAVNGNIISSNQINGSISRYYFPYGQYLFTDVLSITLQTTNQPFTGNIGYALDYKKRMRAYVIQDNAVVLSGYAKIISATNINQNVTYSVQITSDLGNFIAAVANLRLEDLYTVQAPDLITDPTGQTAKTVYLPSPYDHILTTAFVTGSWFGAPVVRYPLIDYGQYDTVGQTNWYLSNLRPAIAAKDYIDLIFSAAGYTYDSTYLNSTYFKNLIIPYKDGNMSITDPAFVEATSNAVSGMTIVPAVGDPQANTFYLFNTEVTDASNAYNGISYTCPKIGTYNISVSIPATYTFTPGTGGIDLVNPEIFTYILTEIYPASGGTIPLEVIPTVYDQEQATVVFSGNQFFNGTSTSDEFIISIVNLPVYIATAGLIIKIRISTFAPTAASVFFPRSGGGSPVSGTGVITFPNSSISRPDLQITYSPILDNQQLVFQDFVPKSVKQIDYFNSIVKLFNLYPVQDTSRRNHFNIYTRDEFYSNQKTLDWTSKIDGLSDITIKPIPELSAAQLLFSYKPDKDWWNKQYNSLFGDYTYGSLRVQTGYDFANKVQDVVDGIIFSPTVPVEMGPQGFAGEGSIEILNNPYTPIAADISDDVIYATGYFAANGALNFPNVLNTFSGTKFDKARIGVHIIYWGVEYIISVVFNDYAFKVVDINGNATVLRRPSTNGGTSQRIDNTYYAKSDGFTYITNSNVTCPAIYDSSDNNVTRQPVKTEMRILYFNVADAQAVYNRVFIQNTPIVVNGVYNYQASGTDTGLFIETEIPYCSHLDHPTQPTKDLLFGKPLGLFFNFPFDGIIGIAGAPATTIYPTNNLYNRYWINTVNEITDKDAKFMDCMMNLNSVDIANLNLSNIIFINGTNFRINQITDYSPDSSLTAVEFIRIPKQVQTTPLPFVFAGFDQVVSGSTCINLQGVATGGDNDGEVIVKTIWTQIGGPSGVTIANVNNLTSQACGFISGVTYTFQLYGIDNYGNSATSITHVMTAPPAPCMPSASASNGGNIILPTSTNTISGTGTPCGGHTIVSYAWTQISGATVSIVTPSVSGTTVTGITTAGDYTFRLTVTDNGSSTAFADTTFSVFVPATVTLQTDTTLLTLDVSGISGLAQDGVNGRPATNGNIYNGTYTSFTGSITAIVNGTVPSGFYVVQLTKNGTQIDCKPINSNTIGGSHNYIFSSFSFNGTDTILVRIQGGTC